MTSHDQLSPERSDHRTVVGAERESWDPQLDAQCVTTLLRCSAESCVSNHPTAEQQSIDSEVSASVQRFCEQNVYCCLTEGSGDICSIDLLALSLSLFNKPCNRSL
jgi:hypothetical protein